MEADPSHARRIVEAMGLQPDCKGLEAPAVRVSGPTPGEDDPDLSPAEASRFRAVAATDSYLGIDRADFAFVAKEACREMSRPTASIITRI